MEDHEIEQKLFDYAEGILSEDQSRKVEEWICSSDEHRKIAESVFALEQITSRMQVLSSTDMEEALKINRARIARRKRRGIVRMAQRAALVLLLPLVGALAFFAANYFGNDDSSMVEIATTTGMTSSVILPDGSKVWLNSNSKLSYPSRFSQKCRNVTLEGEAYFKVTKQAGRRFVVNALGTSVEVYGTEFDVQAYGDMRGEVRTTLVNGHVKLHYPGTDGTLSSVDMRPGDSYSYDIESRSLESLDVNPRSVSAWKDGKIILENTPLREALEMIENRYNVEFLVRNEALLSNCYTGTFSGQRLEVVLEYFKRTTNIHFDMMNRHMDSSSISGRQIIIVK